jgi:hypothetical protein
MGRKHADAREEQERNNDIHDATCFVWRHARRGNVSGVFRPIPKMVSWEPTGPANRWAMPIPSLVRTSSEGRATPRSFGWLPERAESPELRTSVRAAANGIVAPAAEFDGPASPRAFDFLEELEPDFKQVRAPLTRCHSQSLQ